MSRRVRQFALFAALMLIVGGLFWWTQRSRGGDPAPAASDAGTASATAIAEEEPITAYLRFATEERTLPDDAAAAQYLAEGLRRLAGVLGIRGIGELELQVNLRVAATHVVLDPASTANAAIVREQLVAVAAAAPGATRPALRQLAGAVAADQPLTQQVPAIRQFFRAFADALRANPD